MKAKFHLGRNDAVVILFRKIWERELRALCGVAADQAVEDAVEGRLRNSVKKENPKFEFRNPKQIRIFERSKIRTKEF